MKKEDEPDPSPLTLATVAEAAKERLVRRGKHPPTVIVQGSRDSATVEFELFHATSEGRAQQMFGAGVLLSQAGHIGRLQEVFFITEAWWLSVAEAGELFDTLHKRVDFRNPLSAVRCLDWRFNTQKQP
jgi:hypothetical protein